MNRSRSGVAIIIVILILASLMLLGLPFFYSQTWGLAGARSMQANQAARIYLHSAERLGVALGVYANATAWRPTTGLTVSAQVHSALELYLGDDFPTPTGQELLANKARIDAHQERNLAVIDSTQLGWNDGKIAHIAVRLSDEAGKLDPNLLDATGWQDLFKQLGIEDWDDQDVTVTSWTTPPEAADSDKLGELAQELEWYRVNVGRFTRLEDLRIPTPQKSSRHGLGGAVHAEFRKRLNAAEIERLRPYLSFHNLGQGRSGITDLGSVVESDQSLSYASDPRFVARQVWLDVPSDLVNQGTWVFAEQTPGNGGKLPDEGIIQSGAAGSGFSNTIYYRSGVLPAKDSGLWLQVPPALNVHQVPDVIAQLPAYRFARRDPGTGTPEFPNPSLFPITWYGKPKSGSDPIAALPWNYLHPRYDTATGAAAALNHERQPLDLRSDGLINIEAAATIHDAAGSLAAQMQLTTIVQAVPQEQALERRWLTQGQFEPLVAQRFTSGMVTWPRATARALDLQPSDVDPQAPTPPPDESGLAFAPLTTPAAGRPGTVPHLAIDWRAPLGLGQTDDTVATVLQDRRTPRGGGTETRNDPVTSVGIVPPTLTQTGGEGLFPDGVRMGANNQLAYTFDANTGGPLRQTSVADPTLAFRHLGFWFRPETEWAAGTASQVITLLEARQHPTYGLANFKKSPDLTAASIATGAMDQNYFGVFYDPLQNMLVAAYTPPSAAVTGPPVAWTAQADDKNTPEVDERCLPDLSATPLLLNPGCLFTKAAWSQTLQPNRIMTCWKFGKRLDSSGAAVANTPEKGRWHHLQIAIGNGRPGGISLVVDGIAGTDVGLMGAKAYWSARQGSPLHGPWPGDHLTLPSLVLGDVVPPDTTDDLPAIPKTSTTTGPDFYPTGKVHVQMPGFSAFVGDNYTSAVPAETLSPLDTLPVRGSVLIGDEYIRYESLTADKDGQHPFRYKLETCTRGFRQDTSALSANLLERFPSTEAHLAGDRVITDGCRIPLVGTIFLGGTGVVTEDPFGCGDPTDDYTVRANVLTPGTGPGNTVVIDGIAAIDLTPGKWANAPATGYVLLSDSNHADPETGQIYFYTKNDGHADQIILEDPNATFSDTQRLAGLYSQSNPAHAVTTFKSQATTQMARVTLISLKVTYQDELFPDGLPLPASLPTTNSPYWLRPFGTSVNVALFQLLNPVNGRVEWLRYTDIIGRKETDGKKAAYFLNRRGWKYLATSVDRDRANQRTPFLPSVAFLSGSRVLPVQSLVQNQYTKLLSPGDLVTFVPNDYTKAMPAAALVRYSANDGYGTVASDINDTINGWLGFSAPLNGLIDPTITSWQMVLGTGLNTLRDLTPLSNAVTNLAKASLPRLDAHAVAGESGRLVFGGQDRDRGGVANPDLSGAGKPVMTIDAPYAGSWNNSAGRIIRFWGGASTDGIAATKDLPVFVEADGPVFDRSSGALDNLSLVEIGGEVFACELITGALSDSSSDISAAAKYMDTLATSFPKLHNGVNGVTWLATNANRARIGRLVGRALLGGTSLAHRFATSPALDQLSANQQNLFGNLDIGPEFNRLPVGPVRYLANATAGAGLNSNTWFQMQDLQNIPAAPPAGATTQLVFSKTFVAPRALVCDPVRDDADPATARNEIITLIGHDDRATITGVQGNVPVSLGPNPNVDHWITAAWLRGQYHTKPDYPWADVNGGNGMLKPLIIGWWPRFASALPPASAGLTAQHFRSRSFPWISLPLRLHHMRCADGTGNEGEPELAFDPNLPTNSVITPTADATLEVQVRAMAGTIDGHRTVDYALGAGSGTQGDWSALPSFKTLVPGTDFSASGSAIAGLFPWNTSASPADAKEVDGLELRLTFHYVGVTPSGVLTDIARRANRSPHLSAAKLRAYAPVTTVATEEAR